MECVVVFCQGVDLARDYFLDGGVLSTTFEQDARLPPLKLFSLWQSASNVRESFAVLRGFSLKIILKRNIDLK